MAGCSGRFARRALRARVRTRLLSAALMIAASAGTAAAQMVNFRNYTRNEGLPQAQVLGIHQDQQGYIWFATYGGVSRFNGADFQTWTKDQGLSSNSVFDVAEDAQGRMLLATSGGLCVQQTSRFQCYRQRDGLANDNARSVMPDAAGGIRVGTQQGLSYLKAGRIRNYTTADGLPADRVNRVAMDSKGSVWVATEQGLAHFDGQRFTADSPENFGQATVRFIVPSEQGLLVGTDAGLFWRRDDGVSPLAQVEFPAGAGPVDAAIDRNGIIWVATTNGALRIQGGQVERLTRANGLLTDLVNRVTIDREGDVWFGTESGASKHVPGPFSTYTVMEGLPHDFVRALELDDRGRLWAGTRNGVAVRDGGQFHTIDLTGAPDVRVYALTHLQGEGMLIGTRRGLILYDGHLRRVYTREDGLPGDVVYSLLRDTRGTIWIGTERGLARWESGRIVPDLHPELAGIGFISLAQDRAGRVWLGRLSGGVAILHGDSVSLLGPAQGATDQTVWSMAEDAEGRMWVGTNGDGALRMGPDGIRHYTTRQGLASDFIWQVLPDSRGDLWLFGNDGLDRFAGEHITHYDRGSGLPELEGSANAAHDDGDGNLWFGTGSGLVRYVRGLDRAPAMAPPVYVEGLTQDGEPVATEASRLRLHRGALQIHFASPTFRDEASVRFRYRLVGAGANNAWSPPTSERRITYAGLGAGHYRFEVQAENLGVESRAPAMMSFAVLPAFWQTWWFTLSALLLLIAAAVAVPVVRARGLEREKQRLEAVVAHHTRELADKNDRLEQSNRDLEHFAYVASHDLQEPLRKIQAFSDRVSRQYAPQLDDQGRDFLSRMSNAAARMQRLIDDLLSLSRVSTRPGKKQPVDLAVLAQEVVGDLEFRIQSTRGRVEIGDLPTITADPVQMRQVFQNLIGNALKFHRPEEPPVVRVSALAVGPNRIELRFEDNGIGFEPKDADKVFLPFQRLHSRAQYEGTGIGLTICQKIVERHGGSIRALEHARQGLAVPGDPARPRNAGDEPCRVRATNPSPSSWRTTTRMIACWRMTPWSRAGCATACASWRMGRS